MRAQTTLDFAIGITIFLAVVMFVFGFVPGILEPFDTTGQERPAQSDRIANSLSQGMLGDPAEPYVLDRHCTVEFFNDSTAAPAECNYSGSTIHEYLNLSERTDINITLTGNLSGGTQSEQLCWALSSSYTGEPGLDDTNCGASGKTFLRIGDDKPGPGESTITARRIVSFRGESIRLEVVVW
jgi:hypothetical protein